MLAGEGSIVLATGVVVLLRVRLLPLLSPRPALLLGPAALAGVEGTNAMLDEKALFSYAIRISCPSLESVSQPQGSRRPARAHRMLRLKVRSDAMRQMLEPCVDVQWQ